MDRARPLAAIALLGFLAVQAVRGDDGSVPAVQGDPAWTVHGQSTVIEQEHASFPAAYSGQNSLSDRSEQAHTWTMTLFLGRALWPGGAFYFNPESSQGTGLSQTLGVAAFPDGEGTHAGGPFRVETARYFIRQTFGLGGEQESVDDDQNQVAGKVDVNRITVTLGKYSAADIFDAVGYSHDPRTQFFNWALMDNGAWDYPANDKGYTGGLTVEWNKARRTLRWGVFMEPDQANEWPLDPHLGKAWSLNGEWEQRYERAGRAGAIRTLVFWNHAHMGNYEDALAQTQPPDVTLTRAYRSKVGGGVSWEQALTDSLGAFSRLGWNDGRTETWAFTEIDRTVSAGLSCKGGPWGRPADTAGLAALANGLSSEHRSYLAAGGYGFIIGDGRLDYASEDVLEAYYCWQPVKWLALTPDCQFIDHPGYNRARGPVSVLGVRVHCQF